MSDDVTPDKDNIDQHIRTYLDEFMDHDESEMVSTWLVIAVTSAMDGGSSTHVVADRPLPTWQVKGVLVHALDVVQAGVGE